MSGKWKQQLEGKGWQVFEPRGVGNYKYNKYDNQVKVIVAEGIGKQEGHSNGTVYLSKKALEELGNPEWIQIMFSGSEMGFTPGEHGNAYKLTLPSGKNGSGRPFLNLNAAVRSRRIRPGVYDAHVEINGLVKIVVFNMNSAPSNV